MSCDCPAAEQLRRDSDRWRELLEDVLRDIGDGLASEAIVEAREALTDEQRMRAPTV